MPRRGMNSKDKPSDVKGTIKKLLSYVSKYKVSFIIIFAVALSPFLGTGGMHLFSRENSDTEEKFLPKIRYIANDIIIVYVLLNILCACLLKFFGMMLSKKCLIISLM